MEEGTKLFGDFVRHNPPKNKADCEKQKAKLLLLSKQTIKISEDYDITTPEYNAMEKGLYDGWSSIEEFFAVFVCNEDGIKLSEEFIQRLNTEFEKQLAEEQKIQEHNDRIQ